MVKYNGNSTCVLLIRHYNILFDTPPKVRGISLKVLKKRSHQQLQDQFGMAVAPYLRLVFLTHERVPTYFLIHFLIYRAIYMAQ